jgi:hypothetical protein
MKKLFTVLLAVAVISAVAFTFSRHGSNAGHEITPKPSTKVVAAKPSKTAMSDNKPLHFVIRLNPSAKQL